MHGSIHFSHAPHSKNTHHERNYLSVYNEYRNTNLKLDEGSMHRTMQSKVNLLDFFFTRSFGSMRCYAAAHHDPSIRPSTLKATPDTRGERRSRNLIVPFVVSAERSEVYRTMNGKTKINQVAP